MLSKKTMGLGLLGVILIAAAVVSIWWYLKPDDETENPSEAMVAGTIAPLDGTVAPQPSPPPYPANECDLGSEHMGANGGIYITVMDIDGAHTWVPKHQPVQSTVPATGSPIIATTTPIPVTLHPSMVPGTNAPTTEAPTMMPTMAPTFVPTAAPTYAPTVAPTYAPSVPASVSAEGMHGTVHPTVLPDGTVVPSTPMPVTATAIPTVTPTGTPMPIYYTSPTNRATVRPSPVATPKPTHAPHQAGDLNLYDPKATRPAKIVHDTRTKTTTRIPIN
jgi:hypothetical protein